MSQNLPKNLGQRFERNTFSPSEILHQTSLKMVIFLLGIFLFSSYFVGEVVAEEQISKITEIRCKFYYKKFMMMGEENFTERFYSIKSFNTCIKLFKDPNWNFVGKSLIDKTYLPKPELETNSKIISSLKIGSSKYLVKFSVCSAEIPRTKYLYITTDKEQFIGMAIRPPQNACGDYWVIMNAQFPENSKFEWYLTESPNFKIIRQLF